MRAPLDWDLALSPHSAHWHPPGKLKRVRGFRFDGDKEPLAGASEQPIHEALVWRGLTTHQPILATVYTLDVERLPCLNAILMAKFGGQNNLAFGGNGCLHGM